MKRRIKQLVSVTITSIGLVLMIACNNGSNSAEIIGSDTSSASSDVKTIDVLITEENYGIGVDKDKPELLADINRILAEMKSDGTYDKILSHFETSEKIEPVKTYERNMENNQLVVATTGEYAPFDYEIGDEVYGIDKELVAEIAKRLNKELVLVNMNFDILFMTVFEHKADIAIAGITINDERKKYCDFSDPYYTDGMSIAVRSDNTDFDKCKTADDIKKVLLSKDKTFVLAVESITTAEDYYYDNDLPCTLVECLDIDNAVERLIQGEADCVMGDSAVLKYSISK